MWRLDWMTTNAQLNCVCKISHEKQTNTQHARPVCSPTTRLLKAPLRHTRTHFRDRQTHTIHTHAALTHTDSARTTTPREREQRERDFWQLRGKPLCVHRLCVCVTEEMVARWGVVCRGNKGTGKVRWAEPQRILYDRLALPSRHLAVVIYTI